MLNAERFKEINKYNNEFGLADSIADCKTLECRNCRFSRLNNSDDEIILCSTRKVKWLLSEYKEHVKLTRLEYEFLKWIENEGYKYIVRDRENNLFIFKDAPTKHRNYWVSKSGYNPISLINNLFKFVQLSDEQPTSIKEVLENCEVVEDAKEL